MKKILMVMCHPDDEILFGYPIIQDPTVEKHLLMCSTDANNPNRAWCKNRKFALERICSKLSIDLTCIDLPSSFYRVPTRRPQGVPTGEPGDGESPIRRMTKVIEGNIQKLQKNADFIFTHNPYGEYGHLDHKMIFDLVLKNTDKKILITDILMKSNWSDKDTINKTIKNIYYKNIYKKSCKLDENLLQYCRNEYKKENAWTWSRQEQKQCNLYIIGEN